MSSRDAPRTTMGSPAAGPDPSFRTGVSSLFRAAGFVLHRPRIWPAALVPALVFLLLAALFVTAAVVWVGPAVREAWGQPRADWTRYGVEALAWIATLVTGGIGVVLSLALTPPLSSPALERIVFARERELGVPDRAPLGFWTEMLCGLKAQAFAACLALPILLLLWVAEFSFPPAAVVTLPVKYVVMALALAWNLLDYPLTLRGVGMRERFSLMRRHFGASLGFGLAFVVLFWVPCFSVLMLPIGAAAAAEMHAKTRERALAITTTQR